MNVYKIGSSKSIFIKFYSVTYTMCIMQSLLVLHSLSFPKCFYVIFVRLACVCVANGKWKMRLFISILFVVVLVKWRRLIYMWLVNVRKFAKWCQFFDHKASRSTHSPPFNLFDERTWWQKRDQTHYYWNISLQTLISFIK